jgi:hypothetical protein
MTEQSDQNPMHQSIACSRTISKIVRLGASRWRSRRVSQTASESEMTTGESSRSAVIEDQAALAARLAAAGALAVAPIIVALHVIKPEFEPSWRFISELV